MRGTCWKGKKKTIRQLSYDLVNIIKTKKLRIEVTGTYGSRYAEIFEIRVY